MSGGNRQKNFEKSGKMEEGGKIYQIKENKVEI